MLPTAPIRVLIADDIPELRTLLRTALQGRGFQLVGEAGDGRETLDLAVDREPDVVVLDLGMPSLDGPGLVAELRRRAPAVRVVALSAFVDTALRRRAIDLGAHACLDKDVDPDTLVKSLREVCGRAFGPIALPTPTSLVGLAADELERLWSTLAAAPVATAVVGPDGRFLKVNAALSALVGHPEEALLAAGYQAVVHPEDRDNDLEQLQRLLGGEATGYQLQQRCRRVDGEAISVLCNTWLATTRDGRPLHLDASGRPRYVVRQLVDLREGRRPEDQLAWRAT
ncbi:MAG TPA: response regulator, partial [Actinomycetota bacterium]|nr:response regulator [Actinomycetota bacterium]